MGKIEELNLCEDIIDLVLQGESARKIARIFEKRGVQVHYSTIQRWINSNKELMHQTMQRDEKVKEKIVTATINAVAELGDLFKKTKAIFEAARNADDKVIALRAAERVERQIALFNNLVDPASVDFTLVQFYESIPPDLREEVENVFNKRSSKSD